MGNRNLGVLLILVLASLGAYFYIAPTRSTTLLTGNPSPPLLQGINDVGIQNIVTTDNNASAVFRPLNVTVSGMASGADGSRLAIVSIDGSADKIFRIGDRLGESATVIAVDTESLTYQLMGKKVRVVIKPDSDSSQSNTANQAVTKSVPGSSAVRSAPDTAMPGFIPSMAEQSQSSNTGEIKPNGNAEFRLAVENKMRSLR